MIEYRHPNTAWRSMELRYLLSNGNLMLSISFHYTHTAPRMDATNKKQKNQQKMIAIVTNPDEETERA